MPVRVPGGLRGASRTKASPSGRYTIWRALLQVMARLVPLRPSISCRARRHGTIFANDWSIIHRHPNIILVHLHRDCRSCTQSSTLICAIITFDKHNALSHGAKARVRSHTQTIDEDDCSEQTNPTNPHDPHRRCMRRACRQRKHISSLVQHTRNETMQLSQ